MRMLNSIGTYVSEGNSFKGYVKSPFGEAGSFCDMGNMTGKEYPVLRTRDRRRRVRSLTDCKAVFGHNSVGWIDGTDVYYNGSVVGQVTDSDKMVVPFGNSFIIMPDKKYVDAWGAFGSLENTVIITDTVTFEACDLEGVSADYRTAVYVKVSATGVGAGFNANDVVSISGTLPDGMYQLYTVTDNSFVVLATLSQQTVTGTYIRVIREMPSMDYMTECDNRLWGCNSAYNEIYCCALGDPFNWQTFQGLANDSYTAQVGTPGPFTGAATHLGYVLFFKEDCIHKVFGTKPSNYQITTVKARGVEMGSWKSLCTMNETLYYKSRQGMVSYEGSLPSDIGQALGYTEYHEAIAGTANGQMWVSLKDTDDARHLFVLNGSTGYWYREDGAEPVGFCNVFGSMYMATEDALWLLEGSGIEALESSPEDEGKVAWYIETGDLDMANLYKRHLQKIMLRYRTDTDTVCRVMVRYDGGAWKTVKKLGGKGDRNAESVAIIPKRCDHMRIRMEGTGMMRLLEMNYTVWSGSEM